MAVMGSIAWADSDFCPRAFESDSPAVPNVPKIAQILEFAHVFRGRELTRKHDRIPCGITPLDNLLEGGIVRGRISEVIAEPGAGKTSLAAAFAANVTRREVAAWIDTSDNFDPASIAAAGVDLTRLLWVSSKGAKRAQPGVPAPLAQDPRLRVSRSPVIAASLKAAEWILGAGGFGLVILDSGDNGSQLSQSAALRLARAAERSGAGVLIISPRRICGTFAVLSLTLRRERACFSHLWPDAPALFDGLLFEASVTRNKLGSSGQIVKWAAVSEAVGGAQHWNEFERANEPMNCGYEHQQNQLKRAESTKCSTFKNKSAAGGFNSSSRIVPTHRLKPDSGRMAQAASGKP